MNKLKLLIVSISLVLASGIASAASISANATLQTDYTWRGMSQNSENPSVNGGLDVEFDSGFYAGTWLAAVSSSVEVDYYGGYAGELGDIGYDIGYVKFDYPGVANRGDDFEETYLGLSYGDFGITFAQGASDTDDNVEISYGFGDFGISYGEYDNNGDYYYLTYGFEFLGFAMTAGYTDYNADTAGDDEDTFFLDIGIL